MIIGGGFSTVGGVARTALARLNVDGSLDTTFDPGTGASSTVNSVAVQADGKIVLGGNFTTVNGTAINRIARMTNDAATQTVTVPDATLALWSRGSSAPEVSQVTFEMSTDSGTSWIPIGSGARVGTTANWQISGLSLPTSGLLRARGRTSSGGYNGSSGLVETVGSFSGLAPVPPIVSSISPADGSPAGGMSVTLTGMGFTGASAVTFGGTAATSFSVMSSTTITAVTPGHAAGAVSVDVVVAGGTNSTNTLFTYLAPPTVTASAANLPQMAATLTITGTQFSTTPGNNAVVFTPVGSGTVTASTATSLTVTGLTDLSPGDLNAVVTTSGQSSGTPVQVATVNPAPPGTLDAYNPNVSGGSVLATAVQPDGKVIIGGLFTTVGGAAHANLARLHAAGSVDASFTASNDGTVNSVTVQADGKIVLGGGFTTFNDTERYCIARLNANGNLDATFDPGTGANNTVYSVAAQANGKLILAGQFTTFSGTERNGVARLANDPAPQTVGVPDATQALWSRGGSAPEVSQVTFELSTDGGTVWTPLGVGSRVETTANWQCTGLSLPASGQLRARGRTASGYQNGGSGLVETVAAYAIEIPAEIVVEQPAGTGLTDNASTVAFGTSPVGTAAAVKTFTVRNFGSFTLTDLAPTSNSAEFAVNTAGFPVSLSGGASATFTVTFTPALVGARTATLSIASSDGDENPFEVALTGQSLSFNSDTDGDGLNDASEFQMAAFGFDWQVGGSTQEALVNTLFSNATGAGLFTPSQVQALHIGTPLIQRNGAGQFTLTLGVHKSTDLLNFAPFPMTAPQTTFRSDGKLDFIFTVPDDAAFFRLETP
jgi:uncharacterized delta-60 repeat protein